MSGKKAKKNTYSGILIAKMAGACALSWELAKLAGSTHPYLAPLSVILCMQTSVFQTLRHSYHRIIGTIIGGCFIGMLVWFIKLNGWTLGLLIFAGLWLAKGLRRSAVVSEQVALTILLVFVFEHKTGHYLVDRLRDTGIGSLLAVVVHLYVLPPNMKKEVRKVLIPFSSQMAAWFTRTAGWVQRGCKPEEGSRLKGEMKQWHPILQQTEQKLKEIGKSLNYYPFSGENFRLIHGYQQQWECWSRGFFYLEEAIRKIELWQASGWMTVTDREAWATQFLTISSYFTNQNNILSKTKGNLPEPEFVYVPPVPIQVTSPVKEDHNLYGAALYQDTKAFVQQLQ